MSFNQGFGSAQAFNSGQWPLPQNQQHQQQLGMQGPPPQFMQPWQNPLQNQQTFPTSSFGWHASPQHIQYQHTQDKHHARQSSTGDIMAQNQELQKKQQYEEQKRKLKEMSKRGPKSKQEDGKNMLDALISKADLGLSSNSSLGGMKKPSNNRQTNVFTGHSRQETNTQHLAVEGFSHPQNFLQTSNQSATHFPQQADVAVVEHNMQNFQQNLQQWQIQPHLQQQPQQQLLNFGAKAGINQNMSPQYEDDFGDFQGGSTDGVYEQTSGSLNSSTSSLSSLKSSFNSGFQHIIASNPEANSSGPVLQGMYSNTSPRLLAGAEMSSISSLVHPLKAVSGSQHADEPGGVTQKPLEGFGSNSKVPHFSYATSSGFQTSNADSRTFTSDSTHTSGSFAAFPGSSVPEIAGQLLDSYTTGFIHKEEKPMQGQMNMTENPLPDGDGTPEESHIYGCQLPAWLHDSSLLPSVYRKVLSKSLSLDGSVDTAKVTDILLSSNIAKDKLRDIWEMANKKTPGLLIEGELYLILGLVALSQAGWTKLSISKLSSCNTAPIPEFPEHILMELPKGSVFGGDALTIDDNSRSSSPIDPNDKYSVFRSHSKNAEPALAPSTVTASDAQTTSFGWSASITTITSEGNETPAQFSDFQKADNAEGWADFQSSANASELKGTLNASTGSLDSKQGLFQGGPNASEYLFTQTSRPINEISTASVGFITSEKSPSSTDEKNENSSGLFGGLEFSSSSNENFGFQIAGSSNAGAERYFASGNVIGSSVSINATDFESGSHSLGEAKSVDIADFSKLNLGSNGPGKRTGVLEQKTESSLANEFGDFHSINSNTVSTDLFSSDSRAHISHTPVANSASDVQTDLSASGHAGSNPSGDDSWNEFASFAEGSQKALSETDSKEKDIFSAFSIPMEKKNEVIKDDVKSVFNNLSLLDEASKSDDDSFKRTDTLSDASITIGSDISGILFDTPSQEIESSSKGISFSRTENINLGKGFSGATVQSEFASFASFDSSGTNDSRMLESTENTKMQETIDEAKKHDIFLSSDALQPSVTTFGAFDSKETSIPDDFPSFSQSMDSMHSKSGSSTLDDFGGLSIDINSKQTTKSGKSQFVPSQGGLDISEQLSFFSLTAKTAAPKASSIQKEAYSIASNSSLKKNSQSSDFVEPTLDVADRYKALTGVLEDSELHVNEWKRCLEGVKKVFESTTSTMKKHSLSLSNKKEIFESEEGKQYFNGLKEIFAVACRIRVSIENSAIAKSSDDLKSLLKTIERYWREICSFSSGLPEYALPDAATYPPIDSTDASSPCGICLVDLNDKPVEWSNWKMSTASLAYGSKKYHSTCANFWCNKVNPVLPALSPLAAGLL